MGRKDHQSKKTVNRSEDKTNTSNDDGREKDALIMPNNVDTLTNEKLCEVKLRLEMMDVKPRIIALQEVKPKHFRFNTLQSEYSIEGYEFLAKKFGDYRRGRGSLIYIKQGTRYTPVVL